MIAILLYVLSFLFVGYISKHFYGERTQRMIQIIMCFLLLFVFFGFRDLPVLNDTSHYYAHFYRLTHYTEFQEQSIFHYDPHDRFEYGYMVFQRFVGKYISSNPYSIIMISSLVVTVGNLLLIRKYSTNIAVASFLFIPTLLMQYAAIRQSFAIVLFYIAFYCLTKKKYVTYCVLVVVAYFFHHSAIFLMFFPLIASLGITKKNVIIVSFCTIFIAVNVYAVMPFMGYGDSVYIATSMKREELPLAAVVLLLFALIILWAFLRMRKRHEMPLPNKLIVWASIVYACTRAISVPFLAIGRFSSYFEPFILLLLMYIIEYKPVTTPPVVVAQNPYRETTTFLKMLSCSCNKNTSFCSLSYYGWYGFR